MPLDVNINDNEIDNCQKYLLGSGKFEKQSRDFIKSFNTIDLESVPGSGKTTALLAKLMILENKLPFNDASGILVISHTNAAMNEIKAKIEHFCPKLFNYPNYLGTIQSFIDKYLAIPYYENHFNRKVNYIDNDIYNDTIKREVKYMLDSEKKEVYNKINYLSYKNPFFLENYRLKINNNKFIIIQKDGSELNIRKPKSKNYIDYSDEEKKSITKYLKKLKLKIMKMGILCYEDAYFLAELYIQRIPRIISILNERFKLILVDEMQDMNKTQQELLDKLFYNESRDKTVFQRLGDKNQAIYDGLTEYARGNNWVTREEQINLSKSYRLSESNAKVVDKFKSIDDKHQMIGGNCSRLKPHLIIYAKSSIQNVLNEFAQLIIKYQNEALIQNDDTCIFKAIAWSTEWKNENDKNNADKIRLWDYFHEYNRYRTKPKIHYSRLIDYLKYYEKTDNTFLGIRKNILESLIEVIRLEGKRELNGKSLSVNNFIEFIKYYDEQNKTNEYLEFQRNIYNLSRLILEKEFDVIYKVLVEYISHILKILELSVNRSKEFLEYDKKEVTKATKDVVENNNIYDFKGIKIYLDSVHAVKGQTHTATLYLESFYDKKYDTMRMGNQLMGNYFYNEKLSNMSISEKSYTEYSAKMMYVGLSRPTHLLCIAMRGDRFELINKDLDKDRWVIKSI